MSEPLAHQYEAGDVASASAQGFRDGVASVAQQQEPFAWVNPKTGTIISDKEKTMWRNRCGGINSQGTNDDNMKAYAAAHTEPCFAAPVAQQPQAEVVPLHMFESPRAIEQAVRIKMGVAVPNNGS